MERNHVVGLQTSRNDELNKIHFNSYRINDQYRICKYFGLSTGYWLRIQNKYDMELARRKIQSQLDRIVPLHQAM